MSEEILKALVQLYAIIIRQEGGVSERTRQYVINTFKRKVAHNTLDEYLRLFDEHVNLQEHLHSSTSDPDPKLSVVKDYVHTLSICKKVNKTLSQKQKILVLVELLELVFVERKYSGKTQQIIDTVADVFNVSTEDFRLIRDFTLCEDASLLSHPNIFCTDGNHEHLDGSVGDGLEGSLMFMKVFAEELYFVKFLGRDSHLLLNGLPLVAGDVSLFSQGSTVKSTKGLTWFYSDIVRYFRKELNEEKVCFDVQGVSYKFSAKDFGLHDIDISEGSGKLLGIMGPSGSGKTTLLNVLAGHEKPASGVVTLNGIDIHKELDEVRGLIGYVSQDDLLIEELTVFENLFYNTALNLGDLSVAEITSKVMRVLDQLGLIHIRDLKVGDVMNKTISGGQRKRLNIALELIREPLVFFVDEPTSGLSSKDSENVMDLLKELSLRGKLVFVVIHQPSSDIYKMFDKLVILDHGGYQVFYGNPMEAHTYFRRVSGQAVSEVGYCASCGNVNPEILFSLLEEKVVTEFGAYTDKRRILPEQWYHYFRNSFKVKRALPVKGNIHNSLSLPGFFSQWLIYLVRDVKNKLGNYAYMFINLLEAPVLAMILALVIRYRNDANAEEYLYRYNDNIPAYLLMSVIVALFMGLSISAEEIIRDRKIRKRESYLGLSRSAYLYSKLSILFTMSAFQTLTFVLVGNSILEIKDMYLSYWLVLFSVACSANVMGLIASSFFRSAIAVYIVIPLLLIPQMILSGAMFSFDKLNQGLSDRVLTPLVADAMISRWAYEALAVVQFKDNRYESALFGYEQVERLADDQVVYFIPELEDRLQYVMDYRRDKRDSVRVKVKQNLEILRNELSATYRLAGYLKEPLFYHELTANSFNDLTDIAAMEQLYRLRKVYQDAYENAAKGKELVLSQIATQYGTISAFKNLYFNEALYDVVRNVRAQHRIIALDGRLVMIIDPIYHNPPTHRLLMNYRTHFYSPSKYWLGLNLDTFWCNVLIIWLLTLSIFWVLYLDYPQRLVARVDRFFKR